uniref:Uncharacterized protein n=1 Tax=Penaeus semisulcatus majanivirus TaxID=2984274 RepID=A0A9C7C5P9_9VIRU|nr:MAG: hypothetical protein [Penaeus semisulcatus majanivirus]
MVRGYSREIRGICEGYQDHVSLSNTGNTINKELTNTASQTISSKYFCNILRWSVRSDYQSAVQYLLSKDNKFKSSHDGTPNHVTYSDAHNVNIQIYIYTNPFINKEIEHANYLKTNPQPRS